MLPFFRYLIAISISAATAQQAHSESVDFVKDVQPVLSEKCYHCHGPDEASRKAKLRLDVREEAIKERDGIRAIVPGKLDESDLWVRITSKHPDEVMPPPKEHHTLSPAEVEIFKRWISDGAPYAKHWSFVTPQRANHPGGQEREGNPVDAFIGAELQKQGLSFSTEADPHVLVRRLSLDLIGLPPTPEHVRSFTAGWAALPKNQRDARIAALTDELLASPHFGEKWARMWLDIARYADSTGYGSDAFRLNIWPYRDWVINAFNRNLPYDQFTIEQIAGDLLPNATPEQIAATAFHRNTMTNTEGGTDDEEYRVAAVKDRVAVTGQVWMGLTFGCAQCHSHKFDPISHKDYYQVFAIFNQSEDADRNDEAPRLPIPTKQEEEARAKVQAELIALEATAKENSPAFEEELHAWSADATKPVRWEPLAVTEAQSRNGRLVPQQDGSLNAPADLDPAEKYTLKAKTNLRGITGFRLEVLPEGEGRPIGRSGNAVLTEFEVTVQPATPGPVRGRFVRIEQRPRAYLQFAEVQVFSGGQNVAPKGKASQSTTYAQAAASRAIDGNTDGVYDHNSVAHLGENDPAPWWEVDLGADVPVEKIVFWNRTELPERIQGAQLVLLDANRQPLFSRVFEITPKPSAEFDPAAGYTVSFAHATADFSQEGWVIGKAIDGDKKTGWGFSPSAYEPHAAVFEAKAPINLGLAALLTFTLRQDYGQNHNLARIRLSATTEKPPLRELPTTIRNILALEPSERTPEQRTQLADHFRPMSKTYGALAKQIGAKKAELAKIKSVELPIMKELPAEKRRKSFILNKGNFMAPGDEVVPALPAEFAGAAEAKDIVNRLTLARWLVSADNPLTARVAVNRIWAQLFGTGIVETEEDFGTQGQYPTHRELLDWLAVSYQSRDAADPQALGWDVKRLLKLIVSSRTYRQSSKITPEHLQKDPRNRYLSHYPRRRLDAEAIRDQALALSGLISRKLGGPSVYPPQPDGLWRVAFNGGQNAYPTSTGEDRYRRGLYTFWRRTAPNPTMGTFDAPSRETCTVRRVPTNTPLQAFVTLNDPVFVECAQALARRIIKEGGSDTDARLRWSIETCLARPATDAQLATLRDLHAKQLAFYQQDTEAAKKLAAGAGSLPEGLNLAEAAAWTSIANVLLNLDAILTKN